MIPMGPAPVTSSSSPTRSKLSAVCTALPNGSKIAAISSGISAGIGTTFISGIQTYSAKEPGRFTPTPRVLRHRCPRPARQLRHAPQTICPSPDTRCPIRYFTAAGPVSTISPTNSWPTTIGTGTVLALNSSHFQICTSVPQIADFFTLISTSAGPSKGEFEQRLKSVIDEVQSSATPIILFIDEAHTLIGAGGQAGTGDAANLLKPALARGTLRTIAATTWSEYRQHIEKDPALTRRFQPINVDEPDIERCCYMLRGILAPMEAHHNVRISDEAIVSAVTLSSRYIPARQLPDKAVSLLDTACARVAVSQSSVPARIMDTKDRIAALDTEIAAKVAERDLGETNEERLIEAEAEKAQLIEDLAATETMYAREKEIVDQVLALRKSIAVAEGRDVDDVADARPEEEDAASDAAAEARSDAVDPAEARAEMHARMADLESGNPDDRMVYAHVDAQAVASVISDWTGIPAGRMVQDELQAVLNLADHLQERVIGQDHGLRAIAKRIETNRAGLSNPNKPIGVFMLCGPSGVGKTETALALAEELYGGEQNVITINMSEFQESHTVSLLKGAPPGYVGYGEGGRLTEAVRRNPYSVVLLDEVEKAHSDIHELFFQVFDKGVMEDGNGRLIDFKNTLILLTSNVGTDVIMDMADQGNVTPALDELEAALKPFQLDVFPPALLGRIVTIPYLPLGSEVLD